MSCSPRISMKVRGGRFIYVLVKYGLDTDTNPAPVTSLYIRITLSCFSQS